MLKLVIILSTGKDLFVRIVLMSYLLHIIVHHTNELFCRLEVLLDTFMHR